ncbi:MAG: low temperature requirement protein A [Myxococcota bacterium]
MAFAGGRALQICSTCASTELPETRALARRYGLTYAFESAVWAASALVPEPWTYLFWAIGVCASLSIPLSRVTRELSLRFTPDIGHASERYGLLVLIVLGEGFMKILTALAEHGADPTTVVNASLLLLVTCSLWWIYFDDVAGSRIKSSPGATFIWVYAHLPLGLAVTAVGVAMKKAVFFDLAGHAPAGYRWLFAGTLAAVFVFVAVIDHVTERHHAEVSDASRTKVRLASAALLLLLAPTGAAMPAWAFLALIAMVAVAQVILDVAMAPLADESPAEHEHHAVHHDAAATPAAAPAASGGARAPGRRRAARSCRCRPPARAIAPSPAGAAWSTPSAAARPASSAATPSSS